MNARLTTWVGAVLVTAAVSLSGCSNDTAAAEPEGPAPVVISPVQGTDLKTVTLSEAAIDRLDLRTAPVRAAGAKGRTTIPYAALVYDEQGRTWTFVQAGVRTFVRSSVVIDEIVSNSVMLRRGPAVGTGVVTNGVQELLGAEYEVSGE
jgi:hypothetical protein